MASMKASKVGLSKLKHYWYFKTLSKNNYKNTSPADQKPTGYSSSSF